MFGIFLFFATVIGGVGLSGELSNTPTYSECLSVGPAYACDAEHGNGFVGGEFDRPGRSDVPNVPDDDDQCNDDSDSNDRNDKPGKGDRNKGHCNDDVRDDEDNPSKGKGHDKGKHKGRK